VREQSRDRNQHYAETVARRHRVLTIAAWLAVMVSTSFVLVQIVTDTWSWQITSINLAAAAVFAFVPRLHRFGDLVAPLTFVGAAYVSVFASTWDIGTGAGGEFFFLVGACLVVLLLGIEHIVLAAGLAAVAAGGIIALEFLVPRNTGLQAGWAQSMGFIITTISSCVMIVVTAWFALRDTARAEAVMEAQYDRSEALLANMLPASIADRLEDGERDQRRQNERLDADAVVLDGTFDETEHDDKSEQRVLGSATTQYHALGSVHGANEHHSRSGPGNHDSHDAARHGERHVFDVGGREVPKDRSDDHEAHHGV
jgi:hypothetical protein